MYVRARWAISDVDTFDRTNSVGAAFGNEKTPLCIPGCLIARDTLVIAPR